MTLLETDGGGARIDESVFERALCDAWRDGDMPALMMLRSDAQRLHVAIAGLSTRLREVLELFYFESLQTVTIAARLGLPHATVRTRLHRARLSLRRAVEAPSGR